MSGRCAWCDATPPAVALRPRGRGFLCRACAGEIEQYPLPLLAPKSAEQIEREDTLAFLRGFRAKVIAGGVEPFAREGIGFGFVHIGQSIDDAIPIVIEDIARHERGRGILYLW